MESGLKTATLKSNSLESKCFNFCLFAVFAKNQLGGGLVVFEI